MVVDAPSPPAEEPHEEEDEAAFDNYNVNLSVEKPKPDLEKTLAFG